MQTWVVTGVSGSERIELLEHIRHFAAGLRKTVEVYDVGDLIRQECIRQRVPIVDERILDMDQSQLRLLRAAALKEVRIAMLERPDADLNLVGVHATFRWKGRLIPGISYADVGEIKPNGFVNVVRDVRAVMERNRKNAKWDEHTLPTLQETQEWMMVEEFVTEVLAEVLGVPVVIVSRNHNIANLVDLFFSQKKRIYLSYPVTAVEKDEPDLLQQIQGPILSELERLFVVFNPLSVEDMPLTREGYADSLPELVDQLTPKAKEIIKARTIERDFQFIDQSDAVVVLYLTERVSPGVLAEICYAHRNQKPIFMVFSGRRSPFIEDAVTHMSPNVGALMNRLAEFAAT